MTPGAAGLDLFACLVEGQSVTLAPGGRKLVPTGWKIAIPTGHEGQVRPRSGLALRRGVTVLNAPGTIDADYRGELQVLLVNLGAEPFEIVHGERIAQLVVAPLTDAGVAEVEAFETETDRGSGGFGSTGVR